MSAKDWPMMFYCADCLTAFAVRKAQIIEKCPKCGTNQLERTTFDKVVGSPGVKYIYNASGPATKAAFEVPQPPEWEWVKQIAEIHRAVCCSDCGSSLFIPGGLDNAFVCNSDGCKNSICRKCANPQAWEGSRIHCASCREKQKGFENGKRNEDHQNE